MSVTLTRQCTPLLFSPRFIRRACTWLSLASQPQPAGIFVPGGCPFVAPVGGSVAVEDGQLLTKHTIMDVDIHGGAV